MQGASRASLGAARARLSELVADVDAQELSTELFSVATLLDGQIQLRRTLADPSVEAAARAGLVSGILEGKVSARTLGLVSEVVSLRWSHPLDLVDGIESLAAQAAFEGARAAGTLDDVEDQLFRFARIIEREPQLRAALADPALPVERKQELLGALLATRVDPVALRIITAAALSPATRRSLDRALEDFSQLSAELRQRTIARVTAAVPLDQQQVDKLAAALTKAYGHDMDVHVEVDPELIGGVVVRVGDEVFDGSIARRLEHVRRELGGRAVAS